MAPYSYGIYSYGLLHGVLHGVLDVHGALAEPGDHVVVLDALRKLPLPLGPDAARLAEMEVAEAVPIFGDLSAPADGERRGARTGRRVASEKRVSGATRPSVPSDRHGPSAFAVGMRRGIEKKNKDGGRRGGTGTSSTSGWRSVRGGNPSHSTYL